ncbi:MAG: PEGA domain-containing protein [Euryarchaeota archaeon]|nr:PEGA domain-containing protein [Euryarchaeota archaeon]
MNKKTGVLIIFISMLLLIAQTGMVSAVNLTTDADKVESLIEITDIIEKEIQNSIDSTKFDIFYTVRDNNFLWSPDGSKLLILAHRNMMTKGLESILDTRRVRCGEFGLHERASTLFWIYADGSEITTIARAEESIRAAKNNTAAFIDSVWWSSNGDKIVFEIMNPCDEKPHNLYVSDRNGAILAEVKGLDYPALKWSPDGNKINILDRNDKTLVNVIGVESSTVMQLRLGINAAGYYNDMKWSPEGEKIAFIGNKDGEIYTINVNNSSIKQLTTNMQAMGLSWKPDGTKLVFVAADGLYVMNADGSNLTLIKKENFGLGLWSLGSWGPDGKRLYFTNSDEKGVSNQYYVLDIEGMTTKPVASAQDIHGTMGNRVYFTNSALVKVNPDRTEQSLVKNISTNIYSSNEISSNSDGSRVTFTIGSMLTGRTRTYILKLKGYDEVMSIYASSSIKQGDVAFIEVNSMSSHVENATVFLNGREIGKTNESGFLKYSFKEAGNLRLSAVKQGFRTANMSMTIKEQSSEPTVITTATPAPTVTNNTPRTPGFSSIFTVIVLILTVYRIKKTMRI